MHMLKLLMVLTILCGGIYPLFVTVIGSSLFSDQAHGSLIEVKGKLVGSRLLAQKFIGDQFFHPRPSASDYVGVGSSATHYSATHAAGRKLLEERKSAHPQEASDAWTASGSGLDPHISPETAFGQMKRVANAQGLDLEELRVLIAKHIEAPTLGIWGQPRVNVLELNLALLEGQHGDSRTTPGQP